MIADEAIVPLVGEITQSKLDRITNLIEELYELKGKTLNIECHEEPGVIVQYELGFLVRKAVDQYEESLKREVQHLREITQTFDQN